MPFLKSITIPAAAAAITADPGSRTPVHAGGIADAQNSRASAAPVAIGPAGPSTTKENGYG